MAKVVSVEPIGVQDVYDIGVDEFHNFFANGVVVHNCLLIARELAGFTPTEANNLRRTIGKKKVDLMAEQEDKFLKGAQKRVDAGDITADEVKKVFQLVKSFAGYGFNRSHSITYSAITTVELWLKYNYPVEYLTALLNNTKQGKKKYGSENVLVDYVNYARRRGIDVFPPSINGSGMDFRTDGKTIRFSLIHVKNVASAAGQIAKIATSKPFESMEDFYERCVYEAEVKTGKKAGQVKETRPSKKVVESLIAAGAFDEFGDRNCVTAEYHRLRKSKEAPPSKTPEEWQTEEIEMTGLCLSTPPLRTTHEAEIVKNEWCRIGDLSDKKKAMVFGRIEKIIPHTSKKGNSMFIVKLGDGIDSMTFFVFLGAMQRFRDETKVGEIVAVPLKKFNEGDTRFYDDKEGIIKVTAKETVP
jgi:DNA polymerase-3 subunit alpha